MRLSVIAAALGLALACSLPALARDGAVERLQAGNRVTENVPEIPAELVDGDYQGDRQFRVRFQHWMNTLWEEKDQQISRLLQG